MFESMRSRDVLIPTLLAAGILMITMGTRQSVGLYVGPMNTSTGLGIATISFALAIGQFVWGAIQPLAGAAADKYGPRPVLMAGLLILALGTAITPWMASGLGLTMLATSLSYYGYRVSFPKVSSPPAIEPFAPMSFLAGVPVVGPVLGEQTALTALALVLVPLLVPLPPLVLASPS